MSLESDVVSDMKHPHGMNHTIMNLCYAHRAKDAPNRQRDST